MAVKLREDIDALKEAIGGSSDGLSKDVTDLKALISDDGTTKMLFGMVVTIDGTTGAVTLAEPETSAHA